MRSNIRRSSKHPPCLHPAATNTLQVCFESRWQLHCTHAQSWKAASLQCQHACLPFCGRMLAGPDGHTAALHGSASGSPATESANTLLYNVPCQQSVCTHHVIYMLDATHTLPCDSKSAWNRALQRCASLDKAHWVHPQGQLCCHSQCVFPLQVFSMSGVI